MKFSTPDNDNDNDKYGSNCAAYYKSGWWYHDVYIDVSTLTSTHNHLLSMAMYSSVS